MIKSSSSEASNRIAKRGINLKASSVSWLYLGDHLYSWIPLFLLAFKSGSMLDVFFSYNQHSLWIQWKWSKAVVKPSDDTSLSYFLSNANLQWTCTPLASPYKYAEYLPPNQRLSQNDTHAWSQITWTSSLLFYWYFMAHFPSVIWGRNLNIPPSLCLGSEDKLAHWQIHWIPCDSRWLCGILCPLAAC